MSVIKVKIQKDFTVLYNGVLENPDLSFKAKGLWAYCMSKPDNWQFHVSHLATVSKEKERSIYSALNELIKAGLVTRTQINKAKGERSGREGFGSVEYTIYPFPQEIQEIFAQRCFAHAQVARPQNDALVSTDIQKEMNCTKKERIPSPKVEEKSSLLEKGKFVRLSDEDYKKLCSSYGTSKIEETIVEINDHLAATGLKPYKDYPAAIRNWIRRQQKWTNKKSQTTSKSYNHTFSDKSMQELTLPPQGLIMNMLNE